MSLVNQEFIHTNSQEIYDEEFIALINGLNESIKEHYKVFKHNIKETNNFLLHFEELSKLIESSLKLLIQNNSLEKIKEIFQKIKEEQNIVQQLQKNSKSNDRNLNLFFEDAKILFKKMKSKRNEHLINFRRSLRSLSGKNANSKKYKDKNIDIISQNIKPNIITKIAYYLNQLKDYNEIVGKFSIKAKYNYINLQNMIFEILNNNQYNSNNISVVNKKNTINNDDSNHNYNVSASNIKGDSIIFELKNNYENEISNLNNKIKDLEKKITDHKINCLESKKFDELKKKIELELINNNNANNYNLKNNMSENNFEDMILNIINMNKNTNIELNNIKNEIQKKNEIINNLNLNNNILKHDLLDKDNMIQKK